MDTLNLDDRQLIRKRQIITRLLETVREYYGSFQKPIGMNILSAKYSRSLQHLGGFPETIEELVLEGTIEVSMRSTGGKEVYPQGLCLRLEANTVLLKKN